MFNRRLQLAMTYYWDDKSVDLNQLKQRITSSDLVPSRQLLLPDLDAVFIKLESCGYNNLSDLRKALKKIPQLAKESGIASEYLVILRREVRSYFPKAFKLAEFHWIPEDLINSLVSKGYTTTQLLFNAIYIEKIDVSMYEEKYIDELKALVNLTRIQWTSPLFARMLYAIGYKNPKDLFLSDADDMFAKLNEANEKMKFFKGTIGLRDIKRLIKSASYVN